MSRGSGTVQLPEGSRAVRDACPLHSSEMQALEPSWLPLTLEFFIHLPHLLFDHRERDSPSAPAPLNALHTLVSLPSMPLSSPLLHQHFLRLLGSASYLSLT